MPARMRDAGTGICRHIQPVGGNGGRALDDEAAGGVVEAEEVELCSGWRVEDVGEGHGRGRGEGGDARRLDGDVKGVLEQAGRKHVLDEVWREDAHRSEE